MFIIWVVLKIFRYTNKSLIKLVLYLFLSTTYYNKHAKKPIRKHQVFNIGYAYQTMPCAPDPIGFKF